MNYLVSLSGGVSSAVAADRAIKRYGRQSVTLWIADTRVEHPDLWRFVLDCTKRWGGWLEIYRDGRSPLEIAKDQNIVPNDRIAPCTFVLKINPFKSYLRHFPKPVTVFLGLNWDEQHRMEAPKTRYEEMDGVSVDFPLLWKPYCPDVFDEIRSWGIPIPELYHSGFSHNNCGGACVKQGQKDWKRLMQTNYPLFVKYRDWEASQREKVGDYAFLREQKDGIRRPLPLAELEKRSNPDDCIPVIAEDLFSCFCAY